MSSFSWTLSHHEARIASADFVADYVDVPRFAELCRICPSHGTTWSCPPHESDPLAVWNAHSWLHLIAVQMHFSEAAQAKVWEPEELLDELMAAREQVKAEQTAALEERIASVPGARVLYGGGPCAACPVCTRTRGKPCPHPERIQYSVESLGGDVGRTASELLGMELHWAGADRLPPATSVVLGVLTDAEQLPAN